MNIEYVVETSYSGGTFWTYYAAYGDIAHARHVCDVLTKHIEGNFKARIVKKEIVE